MKILSWDIGIYNLSYCILDNADPKQIKIIGWDIVNLVDNEEMKKNRNLLFENIPRKLNEIPQLLDVDYVVIENQPSIKNPQMKSIQMIVYSYFLILGKIIGNGEKSNGYINRVDFCSATNKLKVYDGPEIIIIKKVCDEPDAINIKQGPLKYADKKKLAIEHARYYLKDNLAYTDFFNNHKKKDDLADSFLQGLYYYNNINKYD